jgi:hypothetical protein
MRFGILLLIPISALVGCGEPTYEECVRDAVEDGRSEYGIQVLTDLCDRAEQEKQRLSEKRCFAALTKQYGQPAVQMYRDSLTGGSGQCEFNADLSDEVLRANIQAATDSAVAVDAADVAVDAAVDAAAAAADAAE